MKYLIIVLLLMSSCNQPVDKEHPSQRQLGDKVEVVEYDGCEYLIFYGNSRQLRYDGVTHKGNCKNH